MAHIFAIYFLNAHLFLNALPMLVGVLQLVVFRSVRCKNNVEILANNNFHFSGSEIIPEQDLTKAVRIHSIVQPVYLTILFRAHF